VQQDSASKEKTGDATNVWEFALIRRKGHRKHETGERKDRRDQTQGVILIVHVSGKSKKINEKFTKPEK
jgi:hypothetical protein